MAYGLSDGHVTDDVSDLERSFEPVTPIRLERNISKTAGDRDSLFMCVTDSSHDSAPYGMVEMTSGL